MQTRQWTNRSLPQTLQIGLILLYIRAVTTLLGLNQQFITFPGSEFRSDFTVKNWPLQLVLVAVLAAGGYLIANERKIGWILGVIGAALPLVGRLLLMVGTSLSTVDVPQVAPWRYNGFGLMFEVALFALLVHPQSRHYQRIWFK
jgi:hypothetical protein